MLIVPKFHDYYDTASSFGIDKTCVYVRKSQCFVIKQYAPYPSNYQSERFRFELYKRVIGFCGNLYPVLVVSKLQASKVIEEQYFYSVDEAVTYFQKEGILERRYFSGMKEIKRELKIFFND